jgi:hypothetical protein
MAGACIPGALALVEFHGLRAGVRLPSRRSSVSETWSSDRAVIPLGLEMTCPVHEGRAKFKTYAEVSPSANADNRPRGRAGKSRW